MEILAVSGLGNPGKKYAMTRHNLGFLLVDLIKQKSDAKASWKSWEGLGDYSGVRVSDSKKIFLLKPMTYMNDSGRMLASFLEFHKILPESALVCYDDTALDFGRIRIRKEGSSGGHKGMKSVIDFLGTRDVPRIRIGIGPKPARVDSKDYVLEKFMPEQKNAVPRILEKCAEAVVCALEKGIDAAMNIYNHGDFSAD
ncbi:MAG: aminoacyl-tRNA hydrolase [Elusimicrobia bacterium]|nr:aminoacyl-tRNA hydrolase [Elusimicrobiota bacterium]